MKNLFNRLCCFFGIHQFTWGELSIETWQKIYGSLNYERDYIIGECNLCKMKRKKYLN
jgi:hypothetical protein